jgi:hypothetical protein
MTAVMVAVMMTDPVARLWDRQTAWNLMNDSMRTDLCLRVKPEAIACGCIFMAARRVRRPAANRIASTAERVGAAGQAPAGRRSTVVGRF